EFLRLRRPRHQLAVETEPVSVKLFPEVRGLDRVLNRRNELSLHREVIEKSPARARVTNARCIFSDTKTLPRCILIAANNDDGARTHVLLFANHSRDTLLAIVSKRFRGMLEQT